MAQLRQAVTASVAAITAPVVEQSLSWSLLENLSCCTYLQEELRGLRLKLCCYEMVAAICMESANLSEILPERSSKSTQGAGKQSCISSRTGRAGMPKPPSSAIPRE